MEFASEDLVKNPDCRVCGASGPNVKERRK